MKLLKCALCAVIILTIATTGVFAAEATTAATTATTTATTGGELLPPSAPAPLPQEGGNEATAITEDDIAECFRWITVILLYVIFNGVILKKFKKNKQTQDDIIAAANALIESYNATEEGYRKLAAEYAAMRAAYEKYGETENDRNRVIGAVMEQSAAILEILQFAYANSSKLPQGIKDVINLKYANALKTLGSDEKLLELVKLVREGINADTSAGRTINDG